MSFASRNGRMLATIGGAAALGNAATEFAVPRTAIRWEGHIPDSAYELFADVISSLTVALIATDVDQLETCRFEERVRDVQLRSSGFADDYDHLPVESDGTFCGFLAVKRAGDDQDRVRDSRGFLPLSSDLLIGADTPILSILDPPSGMPWERPRLVYRGPGSLGW